ncbi:hypothetical protein BKI52_32585 [marine bacterium AO1-C]|nr:hypothetical protein BKI52_32585 [marine bacterium AO1-C]
MMLLTICTSGYTQNTADEKAAILKQARAFSKAFMAQDTDKIMDIYTKDASIFPNRRKIVSDRKAIRKYWSFNPKVKNLHHKLMPEKVEIVGNTAYDYGYYEGTNEYNGKQNNFRGKYVVVWKKEDGVWKMYLDIWNKVDMKKK